MLPFRREPDSVGLGYQYFQPITTSLDWLLFLHLQLCLLIIARKTKVQPGSFDSKDSCAWPGVGSVGPCVRAWFLMHHSCFPDSGFIEKVPGALTDSADNFPCQHSKRHILSIPRALSFPNNWEFNPFMYLHIYFHPVDSKTWLASQLLLCVGSWNLVFSLWPICSNFVRKSSIVYFISGPTAYL